EALASAERALDLARRQRERGNEAWTMRLLGELAVHGSPNVERAQGTYSEALVLATELGMRPLQAHCHLGLGKLCCRTGDRLKAEEPLTKATTRYREMNMGFWLDQAEADLRSLK